MDTLARVYEEHAARGEYLSKEQLHALVPGAEMSSSFRISLPGPAFKSCRATYIPTVPHLAPARELATRDVQILREFWEAGRLPAKPRHKYPGAP